MKTIFKISGKNNNLVIQRDRDGITYISMTTDGEYGQPFIEMVESEVSSMIEALEND